MEEYEISIIELIRHILKKWKILLVCAVALCAVLVGRAYYKTYTIYRSQSDLLVEMEDELTPANKMGVFNRSDLVQKALTAIGSKADVSSVSKNISVSRLNYANYMTVSYKTRNADENVNFLSVLTHYIAETINGVPGYKVSVLAPAHQIESTTNGPSKAKSALFGAAGGAGLAALLIAVKYIVDGRIRDRRYLEKTLKYRILDERSGGSDYYDLRTNLLYGFSDKKAIAVNDLESGDTVARGLAASLAEIDKKVLLIDSGDENRLFKMLSSKKKVSLIKHDDGYDVLSYCDLTDDINVLMSDGFDQLIRELKEEFDYIIINISGSNTNIVKLMDVKCDGVVLSVKKDVTGVRDLLNVREALNLIHADVLGTVFVR